MSVSLRQVETALVLSVGGEVDLVTAPELNDAVTAALAEAPAVLIVDLTAVTFFPRPAWRSYATCRIRPAPRPRSGSRRPRLPRSRWPSPAPTG
ncbi:STAS domain-containing protein [Amycolatopsis sp. CA-128772]|uniref:STAS domain-containing protein n=1 Tax=Amycolatopsis sp. CA-128772 TaxID=2073159 RepID=UPI00351A769F